MAKNLLCHWAARKAGVTFKKREGYVFIREFFGVIYN